MPAAWVLPGAIFARLYRLDRPDLEWILDAPNPSASLPGLKRNELRRFGEYRTQRYVLPTDDQMTGRRRIWMVFDAAQNLTLPYFWKRTEDDGLIARRVARWLAASQRASRLQGQDQIHIQSFRDSFQCAQPRLSAAEFQPCDGCLARAYLPGEFLLTETTCTAKRAHPGGQRVATARSLIRRAVCVIAFVPVSDCFANLTP
jgi:hypothetical protein